MPLRPATTGATKSASQNATGEMLYCGAVQMTKKNLLKLVLLLLLGLTANNRWGNHGFLVDQATAKICPAGICDFEVVQESRNIFVHDFTFDAGEPRLTEVRCARSLCLIGSYGCYRLDVDGHWRDGR